MKKIRDDLKSIYTEAISAVNPIIAIDKHIKRDGQKLQLFSNDVLLKEFNLDRFKNIFVVGSGKATAPMARAIEKILYDEIAGGCITVKYGYTEKLSKIETIEASHPIPDSEGIVGAKKIQKILYDAKEEDLVISLISGGGSSLLPLPPDSITLDEKRGATDLLLKSGATIHEINSVRKHLSQTKGGNLARVAHPATVINLMISDVVGDNMDVIASGPFVPDNSTFSDALMTLQKYNLIDKILPSIIHHLKSGVAEKIKETPKPGDPLFQRITNLIIASNIIALKSAKDKAQERGYNTIILSSLIEGDTANVAYFHSAIAKEVLNSSYPVSRPACIISGGETTVIVRGDGLGGRNMEFAIQSARYINGYDNITITSVGTDGTDGPTDAAGAITDGNTVKRARDIGVSIDNYIDNNDSYHFFKKLGDLVITGPTNTNVMDIRIIIID